MNLIKKKLYHKFETAEGKEKVIVRKRLLKAIKTHIKHNKILVPTVCVYCNSKIKYSSNDKKTKDNHIASLDHVYSPKYGGLYNDLDNLVYCCVKCNSHKGEMLPLDFLMTL